MNTKRKISEQNRDKARQYFISIGAIPKTAKPREWVLHHKDIYMKNNNIKQYIQWNIEDLIPMTRKEHLRLHSKLNPSCKGKKLTEEHKQKISNSQKGHRNYLPKNFVPWNKGKKGKSVSTETRMKMSASRLGRRISAEHKQHIGDSKRGMHWWNNGTINVRAKDCPVGFVKGRRKSK